LGRTPREMKQPFFSAAFLFGFSCQPSDNIILIAAVAFAIRWFATATDWACPIIWSACPPPPIPVYRRLLLCPASSILVCSPSRLALPATAFHRAGSASHSIYDSAWAAELLLFYTATDLLTGVGQAFLSHIGWWDALFSFAPRRDLSRGLGPNHRDGSPYLFAVGPRSTRFVFFGGQRGLHLYGHFIASLKNCTQLSGELSHVASGTGSPIRTFTPYGRLALSASYWALPGARRCRSDASRIPSAGVLRGSIDGFHSN